ncbi:glutamate dehydrogenase [Trypanosoma theileri]|uniref:NAD-specific glutamate dehydrogenase n=1 Tax=Trypanosoma theileri TaxID=67003 RepID=A0A1X0NVM8_9TRYP|nr:glutamate dehydrogenase [Trypanosoma theileri]ORC88170.1 glutamate dehydrogenase [Trypanosoma theileri]
MMRRVGFRVWTSAITVRNSYRHVSSEIDAKSVEQMLMKRGLFDETSVKKAVDRFMHDLSDLSYGRFYEDSEVAAHIHGYLCAKANAALGDPFQYVHESEDSAFYICRKDRESQLKAVRRLARFVSREQTEKKSISMRGYTTDDGNICVYTAKFNPFVNPNPGQGETNISQLASHAFLEERSPEVQERYQGLLSRFRDSVVPVFTVVDGVDGEICFSMAISADRTYYMASLQAMIHEIPGAVVLRSFSETFSNDVHIYTFFTRGATREQLAQRASMVGLLPNRPSNTITRLHEDMVFNVEHTVFTDAAIIFAFYFTPNPTTDDYRHLRALLSKEPNGVNRLNSLRTQLSLEMMSERYIGELIGQYPQFMIDIYEDFRNGSTVESRKVIRERITTQFKEDQRTSHDLEIFNSFLRFNEAIVKHNFFKEDKIALCFRLDPSFIKSLEYPREPHGIFLLAGGQWRGFHVRFTNIARGGVRMIISKKSAYRRNKRTVFQENYNLALTQLLKNKDIPEGGSKGTILVSGRYLNKFDHDLCQRMFLQYVDGLLDVILPGESGIVDNLKQPEILFLGPDENTAGTFPSEGALHSKRRGYSAWKSFTTGKDTSMGGIPHDVYGMTTRSVRTMVRGIYSKLGLDESKMTKFQTGGPDGDLGSNEILQSKEKMLAMSDISASLHDPNGIDREELTRLAHNRLQLRHFDKSKLSPEGFLVLTEDKNVKLPDGNVIPDGAAFRDEFYLTKYSAADVFVPCGGRPRSVTLANVGRFINTPDADGESMLAGKFEALKDLKYKIIVEGANLFISQDARLALERCGVVLIKDASANKGGVTSSSLEVYAGLALSDEEHAKYMCAQSADEAPEFYKNYVRDIISRIESNAQREFDAIWREYETHKGMAKTRIADALSEKNVKVRASILSSDVFKNEDLVRYILVQYTPKTLLDVVPLDVLMQRVPVDYQHAICAMWLASEYVYTTGMDSHEFDFFTFMTTHMERASAMKKELGH